MPTWTFYRLIRRFLPEGHPLKRPISLREWSLGETELCRWFDAFLWMALLSLGMVVV